MATELFRVQLLAARSQNRSGDAFFRRVEPLLFASTAADANAESLMSQIVSQFKQEMDRVIRASGSSSTLGGGLPSEALVDRFVRQFSAAAAMSCSSDAAASSTSSSMMMTMPSLASLLLVRPALDSQPKRYCLFEAHANMLLDALESPSSSSSTDRLGGNNPIGNDAEDDDDAENSNEAARHQRASVLLSPTKAKKNPAADNPPILDASSPSGFSIPPPLSMTHRLHPPVLIPFAEFLRASLLAQDPAVRATWARVVEGRILRKVEELCDPMEQTQEFAALLAWKRSVVEPFVKILVMSSSSSGPRAAAAQQRSEVEQWMSHCGEFLYRAVARRRLESIFDDIVDFPDSRPHLQDIADAVARQPSLLHEVARVAKAAITMRLQHAGASTGNVLYLVSQTCRALCVVRPGKAAGEALLRQVCDTTIRHLRARTDAVAAVVAAITDTQNQDGNAWARRVTSNSNAAADDVGALFAAAEELLGDAAAGSSSSSALAADSSSSDGPDILRMLLSVLTVPVIVKEYCRTLSERLLRQKPHEVGFDSEKEVLERLKILLGEDACANASVILKDIETSQRWCRSSKEKLPESATTTIVSAACWPASVSDGPVAKLKLHPQLAGVADKVAESFHDSKQNQSLVLLPHHGFVEISLSQRMEQQTAQNDDDGGSGSSSSEMTRRKFRVNLVAASVVLYLKEQQPRPLKELADVLQVTPAELAQHLQDYTPKLFVLRDSSIELQSVAVSEHVLDDASGGDGADVLRKQAESAPALPAGLTQGAVDIIEQMTKMMLQNSGPRTAAQAEQSLKMFGQWSGTSAEFRDVMNYFVSKGVICSDGSGTYKLV